jgi:hypothetical protein
MRWTLSGQALRRTMTGTMADGEVVWFWHPDADAKFATKLTLRADDGGQKARCTEESAYKP